MPNVLKYFFLFVHCLLLGSMVGHAQFYPVTATPQLIPPYSLQLSSYQTSFAEKLRLTLILNDANTDGRQIRLHWAIESNTGTAIQNTPVVIGATPLFLDNTTLQLTNADLQAYFALQNLQGISPQQYGSPLPEGVYRFCVTVFDQLTGRQLSDQRCATAYFALNDPPFLNVPNNGEHIPMRDPQNIIFQWTPRHLNATNVQYEFTLAEIWNTQMDPQAAFLASRPLYQTTTPATTLLYGPAEPLLLEDKTYAWRVRAIIDDGISETASFKNNGYSEIHHFVHTGQCNDPQYILAEAKTPTSQNILWQGEDHIQYNVQYRKKQLTESQAKQKAGSASVWFDGNTRNETLTINSLKPNTTYEFRVGGQCIEGGGFTYSQIYEFTTTEYQRETATYTCGITPEIQITNRDALETLRNGEVFTAGDFEVTVLQVTGTARNFSGWGYIVVPYLQDTKLKVVFDRINLNTDYQLIGGVVVTDYDQDFATEQGNAGMDDISDELEFISVIGEEIMELLKNFTGTPEQITELREKNTQQETEVEQLLANPNVSEDVKEELRQNSAASQNLDDQLIADASENGPNPEGYNTDAQQQAQERLNYSIAEAKKQIEEAEAEEDSDVVDITVLLQFLKENVRANKSNVVFDRSKYYQYHQIPDSRLSYTLPNGQELGLYVNVNDDGNIDCSSDQGKYKGIALRIDTDNFLHTGFHVQFKYTNSSNLAIDLWVKSFEEYEQLLELLGFSFNEAYALRVYNTALNQSTNDCNTLDVIFETIPPTIAKKLGNEPLLNALEVLADCNVYDSRFLYSGTNENKAIINIINAFDPSFAFNAIKNNTTLFTSLFEKIDQKFIPEYIIALSRIGVKNWRTTQIENSPFFVVTPYELYDETKTPRRLLQKIVSYSSYNDANDTYDIGYVKHQYSDYPPIAPSKSTSTPLGILSALDPVHAKWEEKNIVIPAFAANYFTEQLVNETKIAALQTISEVILPELIGVKFKRGINFVDDLTKSNRKVITRILEVRTDSKLINRVINLRKSLTSKFKRSGNFGYAEVKIEGVSKTEFYAHSKIDELTGTLPEKAPNISLKPKKVDEIYPWTTEISAGGIPIDRNVDTEYKILTEITQKIGDNPNVKGSVILFTERPPCPSCSNVIDLFKDKYKFLDIEIIHNNGVLLNDF